MGFAFRYPRFEDGTGLLRKRRSSFFASFPETTQVSPYPQGNIIESKVGQFRDPKPCVYGQQQ